MAERRFRDIPFEYDQTDPAVIDQEVKRVLAEQPGAHRFQISGHRVDADGRGYFQLSWMPRR